ncbi:LCP family protein [Streptomyces sp. NPDC048182]|uniref:LCP family protein n=1 Tax=Streptomyces sp. NPDC048182 TaxID=3365507 RepID=UPI00370FE7EE
MAERTKGSEDGTGGRKRVLRIAALALAGALLLGGAAAAWAYQHLNGNIRSVDIDSALGDNRPARPTATPSAGEDPPPSGPLNLLVLGSDSRSGANGKLGGGDSEGARSDTAMVVHLDAGRKAATVVSVPRDTLVARPACPLASGGTSRASDSAMFNTAYELGGPVCAVKTVEALTGIRMDHYLEVDFAGFAKLVDTLGGVTVTTDTDIDDDKSHLHLDAGTHTLDGKQALGLARTRYGLAGGSDLERIGLQQKLVKALLTRVSDDGLLTDPTRMYRVADAVTGSLTTDTGLDSLTDLANLGRSVRGLQADAVRTVTLPVVPAPTDPDRVVPKQAQARELWESLR